MLPVISDWRWMVGHRQGAMALRNILSETNTVHVSDISDALYVTSFIYYQSSVDGMVKQFLKFYTTESPKWDNISDLASFMGWSDFVHNSTANFLAGQGVSKAYINELVEAATRVNYGQVWTVFHKMSSLLTVVRTLTKSMLWKELPL